MFPVSYPPAVTTVSAVTTDGVWGEAPVGLVRADPVRSVLLVLDERVIVVVAVRRQGSVRVEAGRAVLEGQTHLDQLGLDLVDRLRTEVADVEQVDEASPEESVVAEAEPVADEAPAEESVEDEDKA